MSRIAFWDNIEGSRMVQDVVIEGEFAAEEVGRLTAVVRSDDGGEKPWNQIDLGLLETGPSCLLDTGSSFSQVTGRNLASPVGFDSFFHLAVRTCMKKEMGYRRPTIR